MTKREKLLASVRKEQLDILKRGGSYAEWLQAKKKELEIELYSVDLEK